MIDLEKEEHAAKLRGSLLYFCEFFHEHVFQQKFNVSAPKGRESHQVIICKELTKLSRLESDSKRLIINVPPGHGKSFFLRMWVAWCYSQYPDCNFLYISYGHTIAAEHTEIIKRIMTSPMYGYLFGVYISKDSRAKDRFSTTVGGKVRAYGSGGAVTGMDGGLPIKERFSGAVIIDDPNKPDEVFSDVIRTGINENYSRTIRSRARGIMVPIVTIAQRTHQEDLCGHLLDGNDTRKHDSVILPFMDVAGNVLDEGLMSPEEFLRMEKIDRYVAASQYQQNPVPSGGSLFLVKDFAILDVEPEIIGTFITADTAETDKNYNDATALSFWGYYKIKNMGRETDMLGLHWLDCMEVRVEPKDLKDTFMDFYQGCLTHKIAPSLIAIEKKSTGVTLSSILDSELRGVTVRRVERTSSSGSKTQRFIDIQRPVAEKRVSFTRGARHIDLCISHMTKITSNNAHRFDDIADTCADAVKMALIDKTLYDIGGRLNKGNEAAKLINDSFILKRNLMRQKYA